MIRILRIEIALAALLLAPLVGYAVSYPFVTAKPPEVSRTGAGT